ncbi:hypothetical protein ACFRCX_30770 [Streptomyces sp. NPDC056652]|uniref:hypothetical protein n=1 Tax=Streptomyces sp. NPDC056652 TaxID=3345893 RepID=UPI0036B02899
MTTMTIPQPSISEDDPYYAGWTDAAIDATTLTLDHLAVRAAIHADYHPDTLYIRGYMDRLLRLRCAHSIVTAAETELAHTDLTGTR